MKRFTIIKPLQMMDSGESKHAGMNRRRQLLVSTPVIASAMLQNPAKSYADIEGVVTPSFSDPKQTKPEKSEGGVTLFTTRSGLKYIELREGTGQSPQYGNLASISYKAYVKLPDTSDKKATLQEYDVDSAYLIKHGNGRILPGLDEGLHTMKVGGKRRIIIPPKLGYVGPGVLGPLPESPIGRYKLNKLLDQMVELRGGNVVFDVELKSLMKDEADQGYYEDDSLSPEDFNTLRMNLQEKAKTSRDSKSGGGGGFDLLNSV